MNKILFLYIFVIIICWTANPFIKKVILNKQKLNLDEYFIINHIFVTIIISIYFFYLFKKKKCSFNCIEKLNKFDYLFIFLGALTSILAARIMIYIIKLEDVSFLIAHIQPMIIALTFIIGYMFFSEHITLSKIIGVSLIILGLICMNRN